MARSAFGKCGVVLVLFAASTQTHAQAPAPPPPTGYQVWLRYRINAARDQHVMQYDALIEHLKSLQFTFQPSLDLLPQTDREDPSKNQLRGTIAAANAVRLLRNPSVASIVFLPADFKLPEAGDQPVRVQFELAGGFPLERQHDLLDQTRLLLQILGFREADAYDHRGYTGRPYTRLTGTVPTGRLETLLKDLRTQPAGWFAPRVPAADLPAPLRQVNPILITEVLRDKEPLKEESAPEPRTPDFLEKISPDLWALVKDEGKQREPVRVNIVLNDKATAADRAVRQTLETAAPGLEIEGIMGATVVGVVPAGQVKSLAALGDVSALRLPQPARCGIDPALATSGDPNKALTLSGLKELHAQGHRGQGVRLALIDTDFRGWDRLVNEGKLNKKTRLVDLTRERSGAIVPAAHPGPEQVLGHGAHCALAAALAAPQAELVLIRTDALDPYQMAEAARYLRGGFLSDNLQRRQDDLITERARLDADRATLLFERRVDFEDFTDETELMRDFAFLGPIRGWIFSRREWIRQRLTYQDKLDEAWGQRKDRLNQLLVEVRQLRGIRLVANPLVWPDAAPLGGASPLSRFLDSAEAGDLSWFQAAGNTRGQAWIGLYQDHDGNGAMEFVSPGEPLAKGQWSREWNFLAWQPFQGQQREDLPAGAKVRVSLQWREPHDPDYFLRPEEEDYYRRPLADLRLALVRQRDPQIKGLPTDAFEVLARSAGWAQRLEHLPGGSVYEQTVEVMLEKGGRFAVRIERPRDSAWALVDDDGAAPRFVQLKGLTPTGTRPYGAPTLPALDRQWELRPRLFVQTVDAVSRRQGRPVWGDFATDAGTLAMPGDARNVITVGAANWQGRPQPWSALGPPAFVELAKKPSIYAYDQVVAVPGPAHGTSLANAYAAGMAATLFSSGRSRDQLLQAVAEQQGQVFLPDKKK